MCLDYPNKFYENTPDTSINLRKSFRKLAIPFCKKATGQNSFLCIVLSVRYKLLASLKKNMLKNAVKHNLKEHYFLKQANLN